MDMPHAEVGQHPYQYQLPGQYPQAAPQPQYVASPQEDSVGSWVGTLLLLYIPLVNIVILIVMACGGMGSRAKQNWARAQLIIFLIFAVLGTIVVIGMTALGFSLAATNANLTQ